MRKKSGSGLVPAPLAPAVMGLKKSGWQQTALNGQTRGTGNFFCLAVNAYLFEMLTDEVANHRLLRGLLHDAQRLLHPGRHGSVGCEHLFD